MMSFGFVNVGSTFWGVMNNAFWYLMGKIIVLYQKLFDCTLEVHIFSHVHHLKKYFETCKKYGISINPKKSTFGVNEWSLLGHIESNDWVKIYLARIEGV